MAEVERRKGNREKLFNYILIKNKVGEKKRIGCNFQCPGPRGNSPVFGERKHLWQHQGVQSMKKSKIEVKNSSLPPKPSHLIPLRTVTGNVGNVAQW